MVNRGDAVGLDTWWSLLMEVVMPDLPRRLRARRPVITVSEYLRLRNARDKSQLN